MKRAERKKQTSHHRMYVKCRERSAYASSAWEPLNILFCYFFVKVLNVIYMRKLFSKTGRCILNLKYLKSIFICF